MSLDNQRRRWVGMIEVGVVQLRYNARRALLGVVGVGAAVLLVILLVGLGYGAIASGEQSIGWFIHDIWVSGGAVGLAPGSVGSVDNPIQNAHNVSNDMQEIRGVTYAQPVTFQSVYVGRDTQEFDTVVAVGVGGDVGRLRIASRFNRRDTHYNNGNYDGPMTYRVVVDERLAARYNLSVGDTVHIGGTLAAARANEFEVVGVTGSFSNYLGAPTITMHLSELQEVSGTTGTDPASLIAVYTEPATNDKMVAERIETQYSGLEARTASEQVRRTITDQITVTGPAVTLVILGVLGSAAVVTNVLFLFVRQQGRALATLRALGISDRTLMGITLAQGLSIGIAGAVLGTVVSLPAAAGLNVVVGHYTGYTQLVRTPWWVFVIGIGLAVTLGLVAGTVAGSRVARLDPLRQLERR